MPAGSPLACGDPPPLNWCDIKENCNGKEAMSTGVEAIWRMLQCEEPDDFVVASGVAHSLQEFVAAAFLEVGLDWRDHVD
jgi:GDP-mannose 4,6 dehydratase